MMGIQTDIAYDFDPARLRAACGLLEYVDAGARLLQLRNLVLNNGGIWTVPDRPHSIAVMYEARLFGVSAFADRAEDLPVNWMRAARNVLKHLGDDHQSRNFTNLEKGTIVENFAFEMNQVVKLTHSDEQGQIIGRAEYAHAENNYYIRYRAADGRQVQDWWGESTLVAV